jgi:hypothetical protein
MHKILVKFSLIKILIYHFPWFMEALIYSEKSFCQNKNPAKLTSWIPAFVGMTICSAYPYLCENACHDLFLIYIAAMFSFYK